MEDNIPTISKITKVLKEIKELNDYYYTYGGIKLVYEDDCPKQYTFDTELYAGHRFNHSVEKIYENIGKAMEMVKDYNKGRLFIDHDTCGFGIDNLKITYYETEEEQLIRLTAALERGKKKLSDYKERVIKDYEKAKNFFKL